MNIEHIPIKDLKTNFFVIMSDIVTTYGDNQPVPAVCPGSSDVQVFLPGANDQSVQTEVRQ